MSIWGKVVGGVAGFALAGPLGALMGALAGHMMVDKRKGGEAWPGAAFAPEPAARAGADDRQVAFTIAVVVLGAKMAKADGRVTPDEIRAFQEVFAIPREEMAAVGRLYNEAKREATGFEPYAEQIARMFARDPAVLGELLGGLFHIAGAEGGVNAAELRYLAEVARIFGFSPAAFERIRAAATGPDGGDPYAVLGLARDAAPEDIKKTYRRLIRENHPDTLIAKGVPKEFIDLATAKMATINAAYDRIAKERGLR